MASLVCDCSRPYAQKDELSDAQQCIICNDVLWQPLKLPCKHRFCGYCIREHLKDNKRCPSRCEGKVTNRSLQSLHPDALMFLNEIRMTCAHAPACPWVGRYDDVQQHINTNCAYHKVECRACTQNLFSAEMKEHLATQCMYRDVTCTYCAFHVRFVEMELHHSSCHKYPITCAECKVTIPRAEVEFHRTKDCPATVLPCWVPGCAFQGTKSEFKTHNEESIQKHMELMINSMQMHEDEMRKLRAEVQTLKTSTFFQLEVEVVPNHIEPNYYMVRCGDGLVWLRRDTEPIWDALHHNTYELQQSIVLDAKQLIRAYFLDSAKRLIVLVKTDLNSDSTRILSLGSHGSDILNTDSGVVDITSRLKTRFYKLMADGTAARFGNIPTAKFVAGAMFMKNTFGIDPAYMVVTHAANRKFYAKDITHGKSPIIAIPVDDEVGRFMLAAHLFHNYVALWHQSDQQVMIVRVVLTGAPIKLVQVISPVPSPTDVDFDVARQILWVTSLSGDISLFHLRVK